MTRLGDWVLDDVLASGPGGVVHVAHHHEDADLVVAVKRVAEVRADAVATLRREAALLADLAHPAILPIREVVADGDGIALVLPFAAGGSLAARLSAAGALAWREAADLGARVAGALAVAHAAGVLHRDVTPGNILYGREDEPRLADFGAALVRAGEARVVGTPGYLDPAVATGSPPGVHSDVYGLGVVLYEALAGQPPFAGVDEAAVLRAADRAEHLPLSTLAPDAPGALVGLVERAMDRDPARRPGSAQRLQVELEHLRRRDGVAGVADPAPAAIDPPAVVVGNPDAPHALATPSPAGAADDDGGHDGAVPTTTEFGPRPPARLSVSRPSGRRWIVAAVVTLAVLPLAAAGWLAWRTVADARQAVGAVAASATPTTAASEAPGPSSPRRPTPTAPTSTAPSVAPGAESSPRPRPDAPARADWEPRTPPPPCDGVGVDGAVLAADVDGRGCALPLRVDERDVDDAVTTVLSLPAAAGDLAGDYALADAPRAVVVGDWDCDGSETPAVVLGRDGAVWAFAGYGGLEAVPLGDPIGPDRPQVVTDVAGCDHVVPASP